MDRRLGSRPLEPPDHIRGPRTPPSAPRNGGSSHPTFTLLGTWLIPVCLYLPPRPFHLTNYEHHRAAAMLARFTVRQALWDTSLNDRLQGL